MKKFNPTVFVVLTVFPAALIIASCTTTRIDTELPANHPASPAAEAAVFVPPPNPFALNEFAGKPVLPSAGTGGHQKPSATAGHGHDMQPMTPQIAAPANDRKNSTEHHH